MQTRFSTASVEPAERVARWEEHNREGLVGLTVRSYAEEGLLATSVNTVLGDGVAVVGIRGNQHFIERSPKLVRTEPKDSVFLTVLLAGEGIMHHSGGCLAVRPGEAMISETRRPYLFGHPSTMSQVMLDVPRDLLEERCPSIEISSPMLLQPGATSSATVASTLVREIRRAVGAGRADPAALVDLLGATLSRSSAPAAAHLAVAREHIRRHLPDPDLSAASVAAAVGVSPRHLGRLFAAEGTTVSAYVRERRLDAALTELTASQHAKVSEIAARWAFSSQAHFTHAFKERFGMTPSDVRRQRPAV